MFVGGLSSTIDNDTLTGAFERFGEIVEVRVIWGKVRPPPWTINSLPALILNYNSLPALLADWSSASWGKGATVQPRGAPLLACRANMFG